MPPLDPPSPPPALDRPALLAALRARVARIERAGAGAALDRAGQSAAVPICDAIDAALPGGGGLARAAIHEVLTADPGAAGGFCALLLARCGGPVLWIGPDPDAWPPGLARFGLSPADLILVRAPRAADGLWAMEEALRCPAVGGALLTLSELDLTAARRLQLAAEAGGALGLLLRPDAEDSAAGGPSAAFTRWRVNALPGTGDSAHDLGDPRWQLDLLRCRGGRPKSWPVVWRASQDRLDVDELGGGEAIPVFTRSATAGRRRR